jgi:hypothetical protein
MHIGKSKLRKELKLAKPNHSIMVLASLFPLVDKEFPRSHQLNPSEIKSNINAHMTQSLAVSRSIFSVLK